MAGQAIDFDPTKDSVTVNALRLANHVLQKGWQAGSVVGLAVVLPVVAYRRRGTGTLTASRLLRTQAVSALTGLGLSGIMGVARVKSAEGDLKEGLEDRVYRLHYNQGQNRTNLFAQVGMAAGSGVAAVALGPTPMTVLGGASIGAALAIAAHVASTDRKAKE